MEKEYVHFNMARHKSHKTWNCSIKFDLLISVSHLPTSHSHVALAPLLPSLPSYILTRNFSNSGWISNQVHNSQNESDKSHVSLDVELLFNLLPLDISISWNIDSVLTQKNISASLSSHGLLNWRPANVFRWFQTPHLSTGTFVNQSIDLAISLRLAWS